MADARDEGLPDAARLQQPVARLLRPLVRLFISCGTTFPALCDLLRELYVNVAVHDFALPDKEQTDSRISLLTGIHRKEVHRLRSAGAPVRMVPAAVSRTTQIVALWMADTRFTDETGAPAPLRRAGSEGSGPTFESLVEEVTRDVRPRAVLDEWLDRKIVTVDAVGRIVLAEAAIAPSKGDERQLYYFGRNLHDHIAAAVANISTSPAPFMERAVHYEGLSQDAARRLEALSRELAMNALLAANREAQAMQKNSEDGEWRWNFGVYVYREKTPPGERVDDDAEKQP
ncbi:DUF6502 family protein [Methylocystis parvus]|uniref:Uncharacterized protein n=1 Tax=Methylocystis parvus TaxID=134 RepID=A0A6B8M908_9HYPH|nr:DUF6502 family protein [Methylocystis parvus]QGM98362.1 hypothetical protein F7D14_13325 [Methylocystis parvus]WBK01310.1 DUF6502 family protein [Methylocystis parvus OBBP]